MMENSGIRAPYVNKRNSVNSIMADVLLAMLPPALWGAYVFGLRAIIIIIVAVLFASASDYCMKRFVLKRDKRFDASSLITGMLIGFSLPVSVPLWLPAFASVSAVVICKYAAGGIGKNIFNPAAVGICVSYCFFGRYMTVFTKPFVYLPAFNISLSDAVLSKATVITSLDIMRDGKVTTSAVGDYFYGIAPGTIGAISVAVLIFSLIYLLIRRTVSIGSTAAYIMTLIVLMFFTAYADAEPIDFVAMQIFSGAVAMISVFMINDYTTTPTSMAGKIAFGVICGALTVAVRYFGAIHYSEFFAILVANMLVPCIEKVTSPRVYGSYIRRKSDV